MTPIIPIDLMTWNHSFYITWLLITIIEKKDVKKKENPIRVVKL